MTMPIGAGLGFMTVLASQPGLFNSGAAAAGSSALSMRNLAMGLQLAATIPSFTGAASNAQTQNIMRLLQASAQVMAARSAAQATTTAGSAGLTAAKTATVVPATTASGQGYVVLPNGTVQPGPPQYAIAAVHPGAMGIFRMIATAFTGQITAG